MSNSNAFKNIPGKLKGFIFLNRGGSLSVKNDKNGILINFGRFDSKDVACAATALLIKYDWNVNEIVNDPISHYLEEFYVFNVIKNTLIFDSKFNSFEEAVDYVEINYRCNEYHNDIFQKTSRKKKNKPPVIEETMVDEKYIFKIKGKFIVKKSIRKNSFCYGEFDSFDIARAARKLLIDSNWYIKDGNEILFFDGCYWIFEIKDLVLTYLGKSNSYEDALDIINPPKPQNEEFTNPFIKNIEDNFDKVMGDTVSHTSNHKKPKKVKKKRKKKNAKRNNLTYNDLVREKAKIKFSVDPNKIWKPKSQINKLNNRKLRIFVERCGDNVRDLFSILDFNFFNNQVRCVVNDDEIDWDNRNNVDIPNFSEFQLICDILEGNDWDLDKISDSSSIYYYKDAYYKVHIVDNQIVFGKFSSYGAAENNLLIYKGRPIDNLNHVFFDIDKNGAYYEFVKFQNGELYKINRLKSLEEIKAVRDILIHSNWDLKIFEDYDLFYMNGFYWELICSNHIIYLIKRYDLIITI